MINTNKSPKIPYSEMVRKKKSYPESVSGTGAPPNVNQFFRLVGPINTPSFNEIGSLLFKRLTLL